MKEDLDDLPLDQQHLVHSVTSRLEPQYAGTFGPETIERFVVDSLDRLLPTAKIATYLPVLAEKFAKERLDALARLEGTLPAAVPGVLFMCVHNAGRSQMAAGWLRHLAGDRAVVWSGGSEPNSEINPAAVAAMAEVGIDITDEFPKPWTDEIVRAADVVITMGCGDACPLYPGKRYEDWELADPDGKNIESVRPIRDEIRGPRRSAHGLDRYRPDLKRRVYGVSAACRASSRSGTTRYQAHLPRLSRDNNPASTSSAKWCDTVGCDRPTGSTRSHAHASPASDGSHHRQQTQPGRVSQRLERRREILCVGLVEHPGSNRSTTPVEHLDLHINLDSRSIETQERIDFCRCIDRVTNTSIIVNAP